MVAFDPAVHGRKGLRTGSRAAQWQNAAVLNRRRPGPGEWVPWRTVWVKDGVGPRALNNEVVDRYASTFLDLPPIVVQRDTFALIDGRHRLEAAARVPSDYVRVVEEDVSNEDLPLRAFLANLQHGLPYTLSERVSGLKLLIRRDPAATAASLARLTGLTDETVSRHKRAYEMGDRGATPTARTASGQPSRDEPERATPSPRSSVTASEPEAEKEWRDSRGRRVCPHCDGTGWLLS